MARTNFIYVLTDGTLAKQLKMAYFSCMRVALTIGILVLSTASASSQGRMVLTRPGDTVVLPHHPPFYQYNMPNAMPVKPLPEVFTGNNGKGLDLYRSQVDGMGIARPDSSFASNMPIKRLTLSRGTDAAKTRLFEELLRRRWPGKQNDSLHLPKP